MRIRELALAAVVLVVGCYPSRVARLDQTSTGVRSVEVSQVREQPMPRATEALLATPREPCALDEEPPLSELPEPVTLRQFWAALANQVDGLDTRALAPLFEAFAARHHADVASTELRRDFMRLWVLFEATRDGGWWRLRWDITDQEPSSVQIWKAWMRSPPTPGFATASATAECDEISALFSVAARHLGVRGVGLFYPTWNHVIAGWAPSEVDQRERGGVVLIPTTQIFQGCRATFDQTSFRPPKHVYEFPRVDIKGDVEMPTQLAAFLLAQVRAYGEATPALLALIRAKRADLLRSSLGDCDDYRRGLRSTLATSLSCADRRALRHLARVELGRPNLTEADTLSFLGEP